MICVGKTGGIQGNRIQGSEVLLDCHGNQDFICMYVLILLNAHQFSGNNLG